MKSAIPTPKIASGVVRKRYCKLCMEETKQEIIFTNDDKNSRHTPIAIAVCLECNNEVEL